MGDEGEKRVRMAEYHKKAFLILEWWQTQLGHKLIVDDEDLATLATGIARNLLKVEQETLVKAAQIADDAYDVDLGRYSTGVQQVVELLRQKAQEVKL